MTGSRRKLVLVAQAEAMAGMVWEVRGESASIGRNPDVQIKLDMPNVGRLHARIDRVGEAFEIVDLRSINGTFVNGVPLSDRRIIADGDCITLADVPLFAHIIAENQDGARPPVDALTQAEDGREPVTPRASPAVTPNAAPALANMLDGAQRVAEQSRELQSLVALRLVQFHHAGGRDAAGLFIQHAATREVSKQRVAEAAHLLEALLQLVDLFEPLEP